MTGGDSDNVGSGEREEDAGAAEGGIWQDIEEPFPLSVCPCSYRSPRSAMPNMNLIDM